ncbi:24257_t:CDS:2, partial [Gigaspora margarita]
VGGLEDDRRYHVTRNFPIETFIITSIILSAQLLDNLLIDILMISCGIGIYPEFGWICIGNLGNENGPFENRLMLFTIGFVITIFIAVPMTFMELSNNAKIQIGIIGAMSIKMELTANLITSIRKSELHNSFIGIMNYLFPLVLLAGIPVYAIVIRYNIVRSEACKDKNIAVFLTLLPWTLAIPFQTGYLLNLFTNWTVLVFICSANFIIPFWLYFLSKNQAKNIPMLTITQAKENGTKVEDTEKKAQIAKYLETHVNPTLDKTHDKNVAEKLHNPPMYRNMSPDAVPLSDNPEDFMINSEFTNNNTRLTIPPITTVDPDLFSIYLPSQPSTPQHPSTPRSISTDDEEFYNVFPPPKPFKAFFPNLEEVKNVNEEGRMVEKDDWYSICIAWTAGIISCILIGFAIVYNFVDLSFGIKTSTSHHKKLHSSPVHGVTVEWESKGNNSRKGRRRNHDVRKTKQGLLTPVFES